jgi:uncharacterized protein (DUF2141 family)
MRASLVPSILIVVAAVICSAQQSSTPQPSKTYTLTIVAEGVNDKGGFVGTLVFNNEKGWAESVPDAFRDTRVTAHPGSVTITVPDLPAGEYAVVVLHDVNGNKKMDRNWLSKPTEQWGMSNNPHALVKAPAFAKAKFRLDHDTELHIQMQ